MKKKAIVPIIVLLFAAGYSIWWYLSQEDRLPYIKATGTIEADVTDLSPSIAGLIEKINVEEGQSIKAGETVIRLNRDDLLAQRERDAQNVAVAEANLANLEDGPRPEEVAEAEANLNNLQAGSRPEELTQAEAAVKLAQVNVDKYQLDMERAEQLYAAGAIAEKDLDTAASAYEASCASLESAQAALNLLNAGTRPDLIRAAEARVNLLYAGSRPETIEAASAAVESGKAVLRATETLISDLFITCPIEGTVLSVNFREGEYVTPGAAVASIANLDELYVKVYIATDDLPYVSLGQKVRVAISGMDREFEGRVKHIASQGEYTPKSIQTEKERVNIVFAVKVAIDNEGGILKPGMPADVYIDKAE